MSLTWSVCTAHSPLHCAEMLTSAGMWRQVEAGKLQQKLIWRWIADVLLGFYACRTVTGLRWLHLDVKSWEDSSVENKLLEHGVRTQTSGFFVFNNGPWMHKTQLLFWHLWPLKNSFKRVSVRNMTSKLVFEVDLRVTLHVWLYINQY